MEKISAIALTLVLTVGIQMTLHGLPLALMERFKVHHLQKKMLKLIMMIRLK